MIQNRHFISFLFALPYFDFDKIWFKRGIICLKIGIDNLKSDLDEQKVARNKAKGGNISSVSCHLSCEMLPPFAHPNQISG